MSPPPATETSFLALVRAAACLAATAVPRSNGAISNHWINLHETGNVAGYTPILIMDVWEHAFIKDYAPIDRPKYIEAFFSNIDWDAVSGRLSTAGSAKA